MARVTYGAAITEFTGSIGGMTFQRNSSGTIARLKPGKPYNASQAQQSKNINFVTCVALWSTLSLTQKSGWDAFAGAHDHVNEYGETKHLNGFQWFMVCNLNLLQTGQATRLTAPAWTLVTAPTAFTVGADVDVLYSEFDPAVDFTGYRVVWFATPFLQTSKISIRRNLFFLHSFDVGLIDTFQLLAYYISIICPAWATVFLSAKGTIILKCKKVQESTGLTSPFTSGLIQLL